MYTKEELLSHLLSEATSLKKSIRKYLNSPSLGTDMAFTFTANEEERKKLLERYNHFSSLLARSVDKFEEEIAILSNMICEADDAEDNASTLFLSSILDSYFIFCSSISHFVRSNEENFTAKASPFSISRVSEQAVYLEQALDIFIKKISE